MSEFAYNELFPLGQDETPYRKLTSDHVSLGEFAGKSVLQVAPKGLTLLCREAFKDISHLLRPSHLQQLRNILEDSEASNNDRLVAYELLKNANISAGGILPMCKDTGTAVILGKKGQQVWTGGGDDAALAEGV